MGTLTQGLFRNQKANDWFSGMTDLERTKMLKKHKIKNTIEDGTLTNRDVLRMFRNQVESTMINGKKEL